MRQRLRAWWQRRKQRSWDRFDRLSNYQWWKDHEDRVYQVVVGVLLLQKTLPITDEDVVNHAVSLVMEIDRRKYEGRLFLRRNDHAQTANNADQTE